MTKERWKDIPEWEGYYQASNLGRIRSLDRVVRHSWGGTARLKGRVLSATPSGNSGNHGYLGVSLCKEGVRWVIQVHRLVAEAWIGSCPPGQQVRHGPNGYLDNSVSNLCYGTRSEDAFDKRRDGTHTGRVVRRSDGTEFINMAVAGEESGCNCANISKVCKGKRNTAGGYGWSYVDESEESI